MTEEEWIEKIYGIKPYRAIMRRECLEDRIKRVRDRDRKRVLMRIDSRTEIYVREEDNNEEYREEWKRRHGMV